MAVSLVVEGDGGARARDGRVEREELVDGLLRRVFGRGGSQLRKGAVKKITSLCFE